MEAAPETSPLNLLVNEHEKMLQSLWADVVEFKKANFALSFKSIDDLREMVAKATDEMGGRISELEKAATSAASSPRVSAAMLWLHQRMLDLYGHLGLHVPSKNEAPPE